MPTTAARMVAMFVSVRSARLPARLRGPCERAGRERLCRSLVSRRAAFAAPAERSTVRPMRFLAGVRLQLGPTTLAKTVFRVIERFERRQSAQRLAHEVRPRSFVSLLAQPLDRSSTWIEPRSSASCAAIASVSRASPRSRLRGWSCVPRGRPSEERRPSFPAALASRKRSTRPSVGWRAAPVLWTASAEIRRVTIRPSARSTSSETGGRGRA